jgi:hypothetical protein
VSILDRLHANRHLDDAAMVDVWTAAQLESATAEHPHLSSCAPCRARYAALNAWADGLRADVHAEADEIFTAERLAAQHAQICRRLEAMERPARVIAFPRFGRPVASTRSSAQRWIGAAAAAGLFVGLVAGQVMDLGWRTNRNSADPAPIAQTSQTARTAGGITPVSVSLSDEDLFYTPDLRTTAGPLEAIDAITPRTRDLDLPR